MDDIESGHYCGTWGELLSEDGELLSLGDLIRLVRHHHDLPLWPAAAKVLTALKDAPNVAIYVTRLAHWAKKVPDDWVWTERRPAYVGRSGLITALVDHWSSRLQSIDDLYPTILDGAPALLNEDAAALFPELYADQDKGTIQPSLPEWTLAEKAEMRRMRANGKTDAEIASAYNITRQRVAQLIGSKSANKAKANSRAKSDLKVV